jgi:hypothetical protein
MSEGATFSGVMAEIVEVIGEEATLKLVARYGGQRIHIPGKVTPFHPIAEAIGYEAAVSLARRFDGTDVDVPLGPNGAYNRSMREQRETLARLNREGRSANAVAAEAGVNRRTVFRHRARLRPDPNQPRFDFDD